MPPPIGRRERALDADQVLAERVDGLLGQPVAGLVEGLLAGEHLFPLDRLAVLADGGVEDELRRGPDVDAGAVALDEGDDRLVGDVQHAIGQGDLLGHRYLDFSSRSFVSSATVAAENF